MKRLAALLLCLAVLLSTAACAGDSGETTGVPEESTAPAEVYPKIQQLLTWERLNAFPVKNSTMSTDELRQLCVEFFRFTKNALWTPSESKQYIKSSNGPDEITKGTVYGGLPYVTLGTGNLYRLMDYIDEETGVVDVRGAMANPKYFGNQCSIGSYWPWARVINSADFQWTYNMIAHNGFLPLGPYTYDTSLPRFTDDYTTEGVCKANGEQIMYQSYAQLLPADGLVQSVDEYGHAVMCSSVAHVEYVAGTDQIDGEKSYITIIDQHGKWVERTNESGDVFYHKNYLDAKRTFSALFNAHYVPFTFGEFHGSDPVEETQCHFSFTGDTITVSELFKSKVTANYGIADIYAIVKNSEGKEVYRHGIRCERAGQMEMEFKRNADYVAKWGTLDVSDGNFTVEIVAQLGTGERPTVYTGKLIP